jgi:NitT/TauT family transport system substrate-binding protein
MKKPDTVRPISRVMEWSSRRKPGAATLLLALLLPLLAACGEEDIGDLTRVRFGIATQALIVSTAPYTVLPDRLGYFEEEGLHVEIMRFSGGGSTVEALDAGLIDIALPPVTSLFAAIARGSPMIAYYTQITGNYLLPEVPVDSPIRTVLDLQGRTVGSQAVTSANVPMIRAMVEMEGGNPDRVQFVGTGGPSEAASFLERGHIHVLALWDAAHAQISEWSGQEFRQVSNEFFRNLGFHQSLVVRRDRLERDPEVLVGLARAISKAMVFADENPEAAVRIYWEAHPESRPTGVPEAEAMKQALTVMRARQANTQPVNGVWGLSTPDQVRDHVDVIVRAEGYRPMSVEEVWTAELLDRINDFDEEAVKEQARRWPG